MATAAVPTDRIRSLGDPRPVRPDGRYVLYWMSAARRTEASFGLQRGLELARELGRPLVVLEALRCAYPHASARLHRFVLQGMADNAAAFEDTPVRYLAWLERKPGQGKGLIRALGEHACAVVADDYPCFFLPRALAAAVDQVAVRFELVDSNGLLPMRATDRVFKTAASFRRYVQKNLADHLARGPGGVALRRLALPRLRALPAGLSKRWPMATARELAAGPAVLASLPIDQAVGPAPSTGGPRAAGRRLDTFVRERLAGYDRDRNHPDLEATSGLSAWLHFGHIGPHQILQAVAAAEGWSADRLPARATGARQGWWKMSASAEAFLDQLVVWRELGFNRCALTDDYMDYASLPDWARQTLADHAGDERPASYSRDRLSRAASGDALWDAGQNQLRTEGRLHNYVRMVWGKKILEWSPTPERALDRMIALNDRFALDGRDPNSYSGILWCLGRYDRPWGPQRPVFGKIRFMSTTNTQRKLRCKDYLDKYGPPGGSGREADR